MALMALTYINISIRASKPLIEPDRVRDDASRKTMAFQEGGIGVGFHPNSLHGKPQPNNLTAP
jgi:predicted metalloenzyme YecM